MTLDDWVRRAERYEPWVRRAAWLVLVAGLLAFVIRGANGPADPHLAGAARRPLAGFAATAFEVRAPGLAVGRRCALLAATEPARERGLMDQRDLRGYDGMLFRFDQPTTAEFYMFHTRIPLSIAFFDATGSFVSATDMPPCGSATAEGCPTYAAARPYTQALEVAAGGLGALGIGPGSTLALTGGSCT